MTSLLLLADLGPTLMLLAGLSLLATVLLKRSYRYFSPRQRGREVPPLERIPRPADSWAAVQHDTVARIERQKVELYDLGREIRGQIDSKMILLRELIALSERQIQRMEQLSATLQQSECPQEPSAAATEAPQADALS